MINFVASGETLKGAEVQDGLVVLQQMLEAWGADRLTIFTLARTLFNVTVGKQVYTLGTGGDWNIPRPARIQYWSPISNQNPLLPVELESENLLTDAEWKAIRVKNILNPLARALYDDGGFPLRSMSVWPIPSDGTAQIALYTWAALSSYNDLTTNVLFPPAYAEAIRYNLAVRLAAEWPGAELTPMAAQLARESLMRIKSINAPVVKLKCDSAIVGESGTYNWLTDDQ